MEGVFGAAIGGQPAFIFTGFMVMIGVANSLAGGGFDFLGNVAFGPVFGPHISFAGGAAAVAAAGALSLGLGGGVALVAGAVGGVLGPFSASSIPGCSLYTATRTWTRRRSRSSRWRRS